MMTDAVEPVSGEHAFRLSPERAREIQSRTANDGTRLDATQSTYLDWRYERNEGRLARLYDQAQSAQWHAGRDLPWHTQVDPFDPEHAVVPPSFLPIDVLAARGISLNEKERAKLTLDFAAWFISQFIHGEQGALLAATHITAAAESFDVRRYAATQVADEARHVEVFTRYLDEKIGRRYPINDNLLVVLDGLLRDSRSDVKFLGMQILVEGLAIGAFSAFYKGTKDTLLKTILIQVLRDEARHVHFGVEVLADEYRKRSPEELREREDMAYEIAILMRDRMLAPEIHKEWFAHRLTWDEWTDALQSSIGFQAFRYMTFRRLLPNLNAIGLLSDRIRGHYDKAGLAKYAIGRAAIDLPENAMLADLEKTWWPSDGGEARARTQAQSGRGMPQSRTRT